MPIHYTTKDVIRKTVNENGGTIRPAENVYPKGMSKAGKPVWAYVVNNYMDVFIKRFNTHEWDQSMSKVLWAYAIVTYLNMCLKRGVQPFASSLLYVEGCRFRKLYVTFVVANIDQLAVIREPGYTTDNSYVSPIWSLVEGHADYSTNTFVVTRVIEEQKPGYMWHACKKHMVARMYEIAKTKYTCAPSPEPTAQPSEAHDKFVTARKQYNCEECGDTIHIGDTHHYYNGHYGEVWWCSRTCLTCHRICEDLLDVDIPYTKLRATIRSHYGIDYVSGEITRSCRNLSVACDGLRTARHLSLPVRVLCSGITLASVVTAIARAAYAGGGK